ncbi:MAG TPA: translocation/assembly module TamB domain-containing protein [Longimicrobiales bacterium]
MRARRFLGAVLWLVALVACGDDADRPVPLPDDYRMPVPRALDVGAGVPIDLATFAIDARDVRYASDGATVRVDHLRLRDVRLDGARRGATLLPARLVLDAPGRSRVTGTLAGSATADDGVLRFDASATAGASSVDIRGALDGDRWNALVRLHPLVFADVHPFVDAAPSRGAARGAIAVGGGPDVLRASTQSLRITGDSSRVTLVGAVARVGERWTFDGVRVDLDPVHPEDWRAWLGGEPPIDAPLRGHVVLDGDGRTGIDASGSIVALADDGSRLAGDIEGRLWLEPRPHLDLALQSRSLQLADRGPLDLDVSLRGHADSLVVVGRARLSATDGEVHPLLRGLPRVVVDRFGTAVLDVDAAMTRVGDQRRVSGTARVVDEAGRELAVVHGTAPAGGAGAIEVLARVDSLPLTLLPLPAQIVDFRGYAVASANVTGTLAAPDIVAQIDLHDVRFDVPEYGTGVDSMSAGVRLASDRVELVDVHAWRGDGALSLTGGVQLSGPLDLTDPARAFDGATLDVTASLDTMTVADMDSARAVVAGELRATGPLVRPHVEGAIAVVDGFAYEGKLAPDPPLDPGDPPHDDLLATAPWPATRLREAARAEHAEDDATGSLPLTADLTATITPAFRIIDEDSDLGVRGAVRLIVDERGATALGDAAIVDGFYAYYGELFRMTGGAFAVDDGTTRLAMSGILRDDYRPLGLGQGGAGGFDRRDPPIGIFGFSTPATVLEQLRRATPLPATQAELASLLLFDVPVQPVDAWHHELVWRAADPTELIGHRSAIQGAGLAWSYVADELYDYVPLERGYLRAGTLRTGSRYPGWIMLGTQLEAGANAGDHTTARATYIVSADAAPGVGLRYAFRSRATDPADRHVELFNEPRFAATLGTRRDELDVRRRTGVRVRWRWDW